MPGFDGSGPYGGGPMTGRGRGYCVQPLSEGTSPGVRRWGFRPFGRLRFGFGPGLGRGRGRGRGRGWW